MHKSLIESFFLSIILLPLIINYTNASEDDEELRSLLDQKVSSFSVNNQKMSETPNSIIILSKEDFYLFGYQTVSELINTIQGFYVRSDLNYDFIGSRGFDRTSSFSNNQVLLNGHVLNELVYGSQSLDNYLGIDMNDISKIEIVQGPASSLYGSGAMVSLINIKTKDGKEFNGLTAGYIKGTYGSDYGHLSFGKEYDDFSISLTARLGEKLGREFYFEEFKDSTSDGIAVGMDGERYHASTLQAKYKDFTLNAYYSFREKDIPNAPYSSDFNSPMTMSRDKRGFVSLAYNNELRNDILLRARAYFDYYEYFDVFTYDTEPMYDKNYGSWFGSELDMTWDISPGNRLLTGVNISNVNNLTYRLFDD
ncbi:MAG: TonB-dependent receptor plug domain-containing protein [Candidatus Kapaibacterium sp.]